MSRKKRIVNPNTIPNRVVLPDVKDNVNAANDIKSDSRKVSLGPDSKR